MKIHYTLFTVLYLGLCLFFISITIYMESHIVFPIALGVFSIFSLFAIIINNENMDGNYYEFDFFNLSKRKNKREIKDALFAKMKDADESELDYLIKRIEEL